MALNQKKRPMAAFFMRKQALAQAEYAQAAIVLIAISG
jgi:hypothetical protein